MAGYLLKLAFAEKGGGAVMSWLWKGEHGWRRKGKSAGEFQYVSSRE